MEAIFYNPWRRERFFRIHIGVLQSIRQCPNTIPVLMISSLCPHCSQRLVLHLNLIFTKSTSTFGSTDPSSSTHTYSCTSILKIQASGGHWRVRASWPESRLLEWKSMAAKLLKLNIWEYFWQFWCQNCMVKINLTSKTSWANKKINLFEKFPRESWIICKLKLKLAAPS